MITNVVLKSFPSITKLSNRSWIRYEHLSLFLRDGYCRCFMQNQLFLTVSLRHQQSQDGKSEVLLIVPEQPINQCTEISNHDDYSKMDFCFSMFPKEYIANQMLTSQSYWSQWSLIPDNICILSVLSAGLLQRHSLHYQCSRGRPCVASHFRPKLK